MSILKGKIIKIMVDGREIDMKPFAMEYGLQEAQIIGEIVDHEMAAKAYDAFVNSYPQLAQFMKGSAVERLNESFRQLNQDADDFKTPVITGHNHSNSSYSVGGTIIKDAPDYMKGGKSSWSNPHMSRSSSKAFDCPAANNFLNSSTGHSLKDLAQAYGTIDKKEPKCQCGAKHTSFPNHHSYWCDVYKFKQQLENSKVVGYGCED